jgi:hypothetical protein
MRTPRGSDAIPKASHSLALMELIISEAPLDQLPYAFGHFFARQVRAEHINEFALQVHQVDEGAVIDEIL